MTDLQIDYFMAVATNLSFTKTSEELYVSQPAISRQIALLEKELGARLFIRNNQKTELTEVGRLYFDLFSRYKADFMNTKYEAEQLLGKTASTVRVGFLEGWDLSWIIPPMIEKFKDVYPDSNVIINCCGIKDLTSSLLTDGLDIIIVMQNAAERFPEFRCRELAEVGKILLFSTKHRLSGREGITLKDFSEETFFAPWEILDKMILEATAGYTRPYGFVPKLTFVKNHESAITCIRNNMGVGIFDEWVWASQADDIDWIPFKAHDSIVSAVMKTKADPHVSALEDIIAEIVAEHMNSKL